MGSTADLHRTCSLGENVWKLLDGNVVAPGYPKFISDVYPGMDNSPPDAAIHRLGPKVPREWSRVFNYYQTPARTYFFKVPFLTLLHWSLHHFKWLMLTSVIFVLNQGHRYWSYRNFQLEDGYPKNISADLPNIPDDLDAAFTLDRKTYFIKGKWHVVSFGQWVINMHY